MRAAVGVVMTVAALAACPVAALAAPPDGRAYELVSPPAKNGGDVLVNPQRTWAGDDGGAVVFSSLSAFGSPSGTGVATDYLATRSSSAEPGTNGWATRGISPPQDALPIALRVSTFEPMDLFFTADLSRSVVQAWSPLTNDPSVERFPNLYVHRGVRGTEAESYDLATSCPFCVRTSSPLPAFVIRRYNGLPKAAGLNGDGTHVVFESSLRLTDDAVDGGSSGANNVYEYDNGALRLASVLPGELSAADARAGQGTTVTAGYTPHVLSTDGGRVVFTADPTWCSAALGSYACGDVYVRDRTGLAPASYLANASERTPADPGGHQPAIYWDASADGSRVVFSSNEKLTDDDGNGIYMYDLAASPGRRLKVLSVQDPSLSATPSTAEVVVAVSDDGRSVYFTASQQLVAGRPAISAGTGLFLWTDRAGSPPGGELRFIAMVSPSIAATTDNEVAGQNAMINQRQSRVSPDGRFLLFATLAGTGLLSLHGGTDYDQGSCSDTGIGNGCREFYVYDSQDDSLACASCRPGSGVPTNSASLSLRGDVGAALSTSYQNRAMSADGSRVFFTTADAVVPEDTNDAPDAYEWTAATGPRLISDGTSPSGSYFLDASEDGADVFIVTRAQLVGWDTDASWDLYDVRAPGPGHAAGFPEPPAPVVPCAGIDACHGAALPAPSPGPVGSTDRSEGNVPGAPVCRGGFVRRTVKGQDRCVKKKPRHRLTRCRRGKVRRRVHGKVRCVKRPRHHARKAGGR